MGAREGRSSVSERGKSERGKTVHGDAANAGHRVLAPDDAEVEAYLETALKALQAKQKQADMPAQVKTDVVLVTKGSK